MNIEEPIKRFVQFCLATDGQVEDHGTLLEELDLLLVSTQIGEFEYDDQDYPEPPKKDYAKMRDILCSRFPKLGFYCTGDGDPKYIDKAEILVGDAIDDLADMLCDLEEVLWYLNNTSLNNSLWHYQLSFRSHWGLHARELQLHLHKEWW